MYNFDKNINQTSGPPLKKVSIVESNKLISNSREKSNIASIFNNICIL